MKSIKLNIFRTILFLGLFIGWTNAHSTDNELLEAFYNPTKYNEIVERGVRRLKKLVADNELYASFGQYDKMRFIFSLDKEPLHGVFIVNKKARNLVDEDTQKEMNKLLAEMAGGNQKIKINKIHFYVTVASYNLQESMKQVVIRPKPRAFYNKKEFTDFKQELLRQIFRRGLSKKDHFQGEFGALMMISEEKSNIIEGEAKVNYEVQLAVGAKLKGAVKKIRSRLYQDRRKKFDTNPYNPASFFQNGKRAFRHHIKVSCEEFLWNDYINGPKIYKNARVWETAIRRRPLVLLANPRIKGDFTGLPEGEYLENFGKVYLLLGAMIATPILLEYATISVSWQTLAAYFEGQALIDAAKEVAIHGVIEAGMMYFFEGKNWDEITKHFASTKFIKEASLAGLTGIFEGKLDEGLAVAQILSCAKIDLNKQNFTVDRKCALEAFVTYIVSKALSGNHIERLQKVFKGNREKFIDGLAKLGVACEYIGQIASTLNLNIPTDQLCALVDAKRKSKKKKGDPKKDKKDDPKKNDPKKDKKDDKKKDGSSQAEKFIVRGKGTKKLKLYVVKKKKTTKNKKNSKSGEEEILLAEAITDKKGKLDVLTNMSAKNVKGYKKEFILEKFFAKLPDNIEGVYVNKKESMAMSDPLGKRARNNGYVKLRGAGSGTIFTKKDYHIKQEGADWIVFESSAEKKKLAEGTYFKTRNSLRLSIESGVPKNEKSSVLDALWKKLSAKGVNVIFTRQGDHATAVNNSTKNQSSLNTAGKQTVIGGWAANKGFIYTIPRYGDKGEKVNSVRFTKTACFVAGTLVWLKDYTTTNIENIREGDWVRVLDTETGLETIGQVSLALRKAASVLVKIYTAADTLLVTPEHPFYVNDQWVPAGKLKKGDRLTLLDRKSLLATKTRHLARSEEVLINQVVTQDTLVTVYNFTVARYHNYYVGHSGVLVHNSTCYPNIETKLLKTTPEGYYAYYEAEGKDGKTTTEKRLGQVEIKNSENNLLTFSFDKRIPKHLREDKGFKHQILKKLLKRQEKKNKSFAGIALPKTGDKNYQLINEWAQKEGFKKKAPFDGVIALLKEGDGLKVILDGNNAQLSDGKNHYNKALAEVLVDEKKKVLKFKFKMNNDELKKYLDELQKNTPKKPFENVVELKKEVLKKLFGKYVKNGTTKPAYAISWNKNSNNNNHDRANLHLLEQTNLSIINNYKYAYKTGSSFKMTTEPYDVGEEKSIMRIAQGTKKSEASKKVDNKITKVAYKQDNKALEFDLGFDDYDGFEAFEKYFKSKYNGKQVDQYVLKLKDKERLKKGKGFVKWATKNKVEFRFNFKDKIQILKKPFIVKVTSKDKTWDAYLGYKLDEHKEDVTQKAYHITYNFQKEPYHLKFELKADVLKKYKSSALKAAAFNVYEYIAGRGNKKKLPKVAGIFIKLSNTISDVHKKIGNISIVADGYDQKLTDIIKADDVTSTLVFPNQYKVFYYLDGIGIGTPFDIKPGKETNNGQDEKVIVAECKDKEVGKISLIKSKGYFSFLRLFENEPRLFYNFKTVLDVLYNKVQGGDTKFNMFSFSEQDNGKKNRYLTQLKDWGAKNGFTKEVTQNSGVAIKLFAKAQTPEMIVNNPKASDVTISMRYGGQVIKDKNNATVLFAKVSFKKKGFDAKDVLYIDFSKNLPKLIKDNRVEYQSYKEDINQLKADILTAILKKISKERYQIIQIGKDYQYLKLWVKTNTSSKFKYLHKFSDNKSVRDVSLLSVKDAFWLSDNKYLLVQDKVSSSNPIWDVSLGQQVKDIQSTNTQSTQIVKVGYDDAKGILTFKDIKGLKREGFDAIVAHVSRPANNGKPRNIMGVAVKRDVIQKAPKARKALKSWLRSKMLNYQYGIVVENTVPQNLITYPQYYLKKLADYFKVFKKVFANTSVSKTNIETYLFMKQAVLIFANNGNKISDKEWAVVLGYDMPSGEGWKFKSTITTFRFKFSEDGKGIAFIDKDDDQVKKKRPYNLKSFVFNDHFRKQMNAIFEAPGIKSYCANISAVLFDKKEASDEIRKLEADRAKNEQKIVEIAKNKINPIARWIFTENSLMKGSKFVFTSKESNTIMITSQPCFPAGTLVKTGQGYKPIEQITTQDSVYARQTNTNQVTLQPVLNTTQKPTHQLVKIYGEGQLLVQPTPNHRFYLGASEASAGRWVAAGDLQPGDSLWLFGQRRIAIDSLVRVDTVITVYNFEVANYHTYYVGKQCILVHNDCSTQLPEMLVEVQESGKSAVQSILARAQSMSKQLQSNQRSNPKLKVVKSKVSIKVKRNKVSGFYPYSLSFQGKKQDINQSKAPELIANAYLGKENVFEYNEDLDNNKPGGSAYNEKYVLAIFRDMIYDQQNSQPEKKDVHCLMFPIIPHPDVENMVRSNAKELLRPLLANFKNSQKSVLNDGINYLPITVKQARLRNPIAYGKYSNFLEEALKAITEKYKNKNNKIEISPEALRSELLNVIHQARRYFGKKAVPLFNKKNDYAQRIGPPESIILNWDLRYEPLEPGLEGITYRMIELGIDLFFRKNTNSRLQGKVLSRRVTKKDIEEGGIARAFRQNEKFKQIAQRLYKEVQKSKGTSYLYNRKDEDQKDLLQQLMRVYLLKSLSKEDTRTTKSFTAAFLAMTIRSSRTKLGGSPFKGSNLLFINGLKSLSISDEEDIIQICAGLQIPELIRKAIINSVKSQHDISKNLKNSNSKSFNTWSDEKLPKVWSQVLQKVGDHYVVQKGWTVYGLTHLGNRQFKKTLIAESGETVQLNEPFLTDNNPATALRCMYKGENSTDPDKDLLLIEGLKFSDLNDMEKDFVANVAGLTLPIRESNKPGAWWNTHYTIDVKDSKGIATEFAYGVYFNGVVLAALHYTARYKPGEPLPWWAGYMKAGTEWLWAGLSNLPDF